MKNIFKSLMLVAVAAMGFACQENMEGFTPERANEVVMTISAELDESTRTYISDEANGKIAWSEGDQLKVIENSAVYSTTEAATIAADGKAKFSVSFPANTSASEFTYDAIFPASAVVEDDAEKVNVEKIKVIVKDQQKPTATSFDPQADVLVANQLVFDAQPTELNMQFKRLVAMGKMTLKNMPEDAKIAQVVFTAGANDGVAGRNYVNATTGKVLEYGYFGKTNVLTMSYDEAISTRDIYFTCNPFAMEAGETFKVKVVCEDKTYNKDFTIADGRSLTFTEGNLGTFSVDMTGATVETSFSFADGNYAVIAKSGSKYYAMKGVKGSGNFMSYSAVTYDGAATFSTEDETLVWTIASADGGYTFQNNESKYLYWASGNYAYLGDAQTLTITPIDGTNTYYVAVKETPERVLSYNASSPRFAFYGNKNQVCQLYLVPVVEPEPETYKLYLNNEDGWSKVNVYAWDENSNQLLGEWPGTEMTEKETVDGVEYFVYALSAEFTGKTINVIFNNGEGKQTADITDVEITKDNFFTNYVEPAVTETYLYLKPNANWKVDNARFAAYFFGAGETWVDATLVEGETDIYSVAAPAGYPNVIFCRMNPNAAENNWNNKWNQTADLKVPTDGTNFYTVKENTWDNGGGTWSTYTPAVVALDAPEVTVAVDVNVITLTWNAVAGAKHYTVQVDDDVVENVDETSYSFVGDYEVEYMFTIKAIAADTTKNSDSEAVVVKATTEAKPAPVYTTVAEFLAAPENETDMYTLKGTITAVANTTYGNFDLTDDTGTVLIYGLMSPDGATNKYWSESKAKLGDDIVVKTIRTSFNNTPQGKNAWFVELVSPGTRAFYTVDPAAVDFASAGGEQDIEVSAYNTTAAVTATSDNDAFAVAVNGYVVTVTAAANELEQDVTGNITIKVGDLEATVVKATLAAKPASGVVEGGSDDFHTITSTNTSYVTGKTTAGWSYKNCAIFKGGTSNSSPAFKMIGDASNRALCMNGKTSAKGTITSPTLTTGCGKLSLKYGNVFSESNGVDFTVTIKQNGTAVKTYKVDVNSITQYNAYTWEQDVNVAGDFVIEITNNSPSNSSKNKDRVSIWDIEWTGYAE